jgi:hypothetical protein
VTALLRQRVVPGEDIAEQVGGLTRRWPRGQGGIATNAERGRARAGWASQCSATLLRCAWVAQQARNLLTDLGDRADELRRSALLYQAAASGRSANATAGRARMPPSGQLP